MYMYFHLHILASTKYLFYRDIKLIANSFTPFLMHQWLELLTFKLFIIKLLYLFQANGDAELSYESIVMLHKEASAFYSNSIMQNIGYKVKFNAILYLISVLHTTSKRCMKDVLCRQNSSAQHWKTHYETLGVPSTASEKEIKAAYIELCKKVWTPKRVHKHLISFN